MKKYILIGALVVLSVAVPFTGYAQTNVSATASLQAQISGLLSQIQNLREQIVGLRNQASEIGQTSKKIEKEEKKQEKEEKKEEKRQLKIARSLFRGLSGDDVRQLQELLAQDPDIYPEGVISGYFGPATERAVKRFQKKCGIEQVGTVGPKTLQQLARIFAQTENKLDRMGADTDPLVPAFEKIASTTLSATTTPSGNQYVVCHNAKKKNPTTMTVGVSDVFTHLAHGDKIGVCSSGGTATTTPDKTAPILFGISASPSTTSASVSWQTNESADSHVWYATSTPVLNASVKGHASNASLTTSHLLSFTGLEQGTVYYFVVTSKDAFGNTATSTTGAFTTTSTPSDTTDPVIHNVSTSPGVGTASVLWLTNEPATSRVWYATTPNVMADTGRLSVSDSSLLTSHSANLTGLTQGTNYYFLLVSADAANNIATSTSNLYVFSTNTLSISSVTATPTTTSATVNWQTNIASDSTVWYANATPVMSALGRASVTLGASVTSHSLALPGLATSTAYYYLTVSRDAYGNTATSSENSFATLSD